jgi:hypothetical protein
VTAREVSAALGGRSAEVTLRGPVLEALPVVRAYEDELAAIGAERRAELIEDADAVLAHRFDLLGSGEVGLGPEIDWQLDFTTGGRWPMVHIYRLPLRIGGGSDVHIPLELNRFNHLPLLAAAHRVSGDRRYLDEVGRQVEDWIEANPVEFGVGWLTGMDVALRATNWLAALVICCDDARDEPWFQHAVASLLLHGRHLRRHRSRHGTRNNKYLCELSALIALSALFRGPEGRRWADWAGRQLERELRFQVHEDGSTFEASTSYHRLSAEVLVCGFRALEGPGRPLPPWCRERLDRMFGFIADYTGPDGLAPNIGDGADSRFLPLSDYPRADPRSHTGVFTRAGREYVPRTEHAAYPGGGYYVMRGSDLYAIVRCGDLGSAGYGWHAHNDQLSFQLALGRQRLVIDPGTYTYTGRPEARVLFRSTAFHSTLEIGGAEQNELDTAELFVLPDRSRAEVLRFETTGGRGTFEGRHHGYQALSPPVVHNRRLEFDGPTGTLTVIDMVSGAGSHPLRWTFPLAPCAAEASDGAATAEFDSARLRIEGDGLEFSVEQGWYSPRYGVRVPTPFIRARRQGRPGEDLTRIVLTALR